MIVLRKLINNLLQERFYSDSKISAIENIYGNNNPLGRRILLELMKILEMYEFDNGDYIPPLDR